jgi:RNA polymerase sigma factor (sigma-70 family)
MNGGTALTTSSDTQEIDFKSVLERAEADLMVAKESGDPDELIRANAALVEATEAALEAAMSEDVPASSLEVLDDEVVEEEVSFKDKNSALHARWKAAKEDEARHREAGEDRQALLAKERADTLANEVVRANHGLASAEAKKFLTPGDDSWQDYKSAGLMGLWEAFTKWDPEASTLGTFSRFYIKGAIQRTVRRVEFARMSQTDFNRRREVLESMAKLTRELGRTPSHAEVAADTKLSAGLVERALSQRARSLDAPVGDGTMTLGDLYDNGGDDRDVDFSEEQLERLRSLFDALAPDEVWVMAQRYGMAGGPPRSLVEVADDIGIGREIARRTEKRAINKLTEAAKAL